MQINYDRLKSILSQQLAPIYLVHGDEPLLVQEACLTIREYAKQAGFTEHIRFNIDNQSNWNSFSEKFANFSLFAEQQLFELQLQTAITAQGSQVLQEYIKQPHSDKLLLISSSKLTAAQLQSTWGKAIDQHGIIVTIWPITAQQLPRWLKAQLTSNGLPISSDGLALVADYCSGNLLAAKQVLEKLCLLSEQTLITADTAQALLNDHAKFTIFELVDACLAGKTKHGLRIFNRLKGENAEPVLILWALARELRVLASAASQITQGKTINAALNMRGMNSKRSALLGKALQHSPSMLWQNLLLHCAEIDKMLKGIEKGNSWDALETLCLNICMRKQNLFT